MKLNKPDSQRASFTLEPLSDPLRDRVYAAATEAGHWRNHAGAARSSEEQKAAETAAEKILAGLLTHSTHGLGVGGDGLVFQLQRVRDVFGADEAQRAAGAPPFFSPDGLATLAEAWECRFGAAHTALRHSLVVEPLPLRIVLPSLAQQRVLPPTLGAKDALESLLASELKPGFFESWGLGWLNGNGKAHPETTAVVAALRGCILALGAPEPERLGDLFKTLAAEQRDPKRKGPITVLGEAMAVVEWTPKSHLTTP